MPDRKVVCTKIFNSTIDSSTRYSVLGYNWASLMVKALQTLQMLPGILLGSDEQTLQTLQTLPGILLGSDEQTLQTCRRCQEFCCVQCLPIMSLFG